jgi:tetratricopeptide (TPR) repeat protein
MKHFIPVPFVTLALIVLGDISPLQGEKEKPATAPTPQPDRVQSELRENRDNATLLESTKGESEIRRREMAGLERSGAPREEMNRKKVETATALERTAGAEARIALFDKAEQNYLEALSIWRGLPEQLAEGKVEACLSALGAMSAHQVGDWLKARGYFLQALAAIEASTAAHRAAFGQDNLTNDLKAKMPEQLTRDKETRAWNQEMTIAYDCFSQALALFELGGVSTKSGDLKTALTFYERALKLADTLPHSGQLTF